MSALELTNVGYSTVFGKRSLEAMANSASRVSTHNRSNASKILGEVLNACVLQFVVGCDTIASAAQTVRTRFSLELISAGKLIFVRNHR